MGLSTQVLNRVAEAENTNASKLETPLYEAIDPDALDMLFESAEGGPTRDEGLVQFPYYGYMVEVTANGTISLHLME